MKEIFIKVIERYTFHSFPVAEGYSRKLALFKICGILVLGTSTSLSILRPRMYTFKIVKNSLSISDQTKC